MWDLFLCLAVCGLRVEFVPGIMVFMGASCQRGCHQQSVIPSYIPLAESDSSHNKYQQCGYI